MKKRFLTSAVACLCIATMLVGCGSSAATSTEEPAVAEETVEAETGLDFHNQILILNIIERLTHQEGISAIINTHYPTNAMSIADEALMLNRKGKLFYGPAADILTEVNISFCFDVDVVVSELSYKERTIRSIVPVALRGDTIC